MADPEIPEVRAELQREDTPRVAPKPIGGVGWFWWMFFVATFALIFLAVVLRLHPLFVVVSIGLFIVGLGWAWYTRNR